MFLEDADYGTYLDLLSDQSARHGVALCTYCLMPNHVHLIAVPAEADSLARALGETHRRFAEVINRRAGWRGHLWQERFWSCPLADAHLLAAIRYVLLNPVRAGLVDRAEDWPYSNARALLAGERDKLIAEPARRWLDLQPDLLAFGPSEAEAAELRRHARSGRPLGDPRFLDQVEASLGRSVRSGPPGRPRKPASPSG